MGVFGYSEKEKQRLLNIIIHKDENSFKKKFNNDVNSELFLVIENTFVNYLNSLQNNFDKDYKFEKYLELFDSNYIRLNDRFSQILYNHLDNDLNFLQRISIHKNLRNMQHVSFNDFVNNKFPKIKIDKNNHIKYDLEKLGILLDSTHLATNDFRKKYYNSFVGTIKYINKFFINEEKDKLLNELKLNITTNNDLKWMLNIQNLTSYTFNKHVDDNNLNNKKEELNYIANNFYNPYEVYKYIKNNENHLKQKDKIFNCLFNNFESLIEKRTSLLLDGLKKVYYPEESYNKISDIIHIITYMIDPILKQKLTEKIYNEVGNLSGTNVNIGSFNIRDHNLKLETIFKDLSKEEFLELTKKDSLEKFMINQIEEIF